jgi:hypothetical protein
MMMMTLASSTPSSRGEILISFTELQVEFDRIPITSILSLTFINKHREAVNGSCEFLRIFNGEAQSTQAERSNM